MSCGVVVWNTFQFGKHFGAGHSYMMYFKKSLFYLLSIHVSFRLGEFTSLPIWWQNMCQEQLWRRWSQEFFLSTIWLLWKQTLDNLLFSRFGWKWTCWLFIFLIEKWQERWPFGGEFWLSMLIKNTFLVAMVTTAWPIWRSAKTSPVYIFPVAHLSSNGFLISQAGKLPSVNFEVDTRWCFHNLVQMPVVIPTFPGQVNISTAVPNFVVFWRMMSLLDGLCQMICATSII